MSSESSQKAKEPLPDPERRGYLLNEYTGSREYFVLRGGVLRIRQSPRGIDSGSVFLAHGSSVTLLANNVLEVRSRVPYVQEYILAATSEHEAEGWHDAIQASILAEQSKVEKLVSLLENGCTMHKYNYSNSKRSRRYFWVADGGRELCWGRSKGEDTQKVNLRECIGIIFGPMTTTFQRCSLLDDASWSCFSLLFMGRTLDLAVAGDLQVHAWFFGMQHLISRHGIGSMPMMSNAQFIARKVQLKLTDAAHAKGLVLGRFLLEALRALASGKGLKGLGPGAVVSGGRLATPLSFAPAGRRDEGEAARKHEKRRASPSPQQNERLLTLQSRVLQLRESLRERSLLTEAAEAALKKVVNAQADQRKEVAIEAVREAGLEKLRRDCSKLESEVTHLTEENEQMAPQMKMAEKTEKSLRKMQAKVDEIEERRGNVEGDLNATEARTKDSSGARATSSTAQAVANKKSQELKQKVQEMEAKLKDRQGKQGEAEAAQNKKLAEAIANAEQERLAISQKVEALTRELTKKKDEEAKSRTKLAQMQEVQQKFDRKIAPLRKAVAKLKEDQRNVKEEARGKTAKGFNDAIQKLSDGITTVDERKKQVEAKFLAGMEDRKRLHNLVLDLKGNIRVFVRVRPINSKEQTHEPKGEATVDYKDDQGIGIYDSSHSRRKWFEFDQVFTPTARQVVVFEEASPLATSVLDGYKVCIFAYGQTGSGKTHTMGGPPDDPGLNTRVLKELFAIREQRQSTHEITFCVSITEIYNEVIRDLLAPSAKKLDVKLNSDGTCEVPGLHAEPVSTLADVMKCIDESAKNRATATTEMNDQSSRSHSIVTIKTTCAMKGSDTGTYLGKIHLIDLAGSENVGKSGVTGQGMKEAQNINKSLSSLGDVIQSLVAKNPHVPYRNSKLTMMLKDSLGGDSKTLMIVCISPAQFNVTETQSSLNFASRARNVELGKAKRNVSST